MNISFKESNNSKEWYNHTHSIDVYRLRKDGAIPKSFLKALLSLPENAVFDSASSISLPSHSLLGRVFKNKETGKEYVVEKVCLQFYGGWYMALLLNNKGSHAFMYYQNRSCMASEIKKSCDKFEEDFDLI
jgi:hypothetical protein